MALPGLNERERRVLEAVIQTYVETAQPAGSRSLAHKFGLNVSPATIRNTMSDLEDKGFLFHPHTSAGRIPTDRGYRFYVDQLMATPRPLRGGAAVEAQLRRDAGSPALAEDVLAAVSLVLSRASRLIAFALPIGAGEGILKEIEFVALAPGKVLVVVVADGGQVSRKAIDVSGDLKAQDLRQAANYLNTEFSGMPLEHIRIAVIERLRHERTLADALLLRALKLAQSGLEELPRKSSLFVDGASALLDETAEDSGVSFSTVRALLRMVEEKERLVRLLNEYIDGPGLIIVIGQEHRAPDLRPFSLVASTYSDGTRRGTIGVIGPMRMRYSRTIAVVDDVARAVTRVLRDSM
jgi:heat-inducible transcriptional repressor